MSNPQQVKTETLRTLAHGSITANYAAIGSSFSYPIRIITIINNTDVDVTLSDDGTNDKWFVPKNSFRIYDFCSNKQSADRLFAYPPGTQIFAKTAGSPSSGSLYLETFYGVSSEAQDV